MTRLLHIESLPSKRESQWLDRDLILLHAAFQVLVDFVEKEKPYETALFASCAWDDQPVPEAEMSGVSMEHAEKQLDEWKRLFALYRWWKDSRLVQEEEEDFADRQPYDEDTKKLGELVRLREHLWT
jgi:hypothetical protein